MRVVILFFRFILFIVVLASNTMIAQAQSGDQILDGIGETGLVARYVFNGDLRDWSRNNLHAKSTSKPATFFSDKRFGKVLSLDSNAFLTLPAGALTDLESISVSGWVFLRSNNPGQRLFEFGKDASNRFFVTTNNGLQASIANRQGNVKEAAAPAIEPNKWVHLAVVVDVPSKTIRTYINSKPVATEKDVAIELSDVFGKSPAQQKLYIGQSIVAGEPTLNALLHDFRIYRVPLTSSQVAGIFNNALRSGNLNEGSVNIDRRRNEDVLPKFPTTQPQLYDKFLVSVPGITVETEVGTLPRFPATVPGVYEDGFKGPEVRVLWPADTNNLAVAKPGIYMVFGRVANTSLKPTATVVVKEHIKTAKPKASLQAFPLSSVMLQANTVGHPTQFVSNRDKFTSVLATTDPDAFLYMFRHAFGQPQPAGAKPLGVWDSKETKLRGHATGHYLTAIAQAYAGTGYDKKLQADFARKMEYMINSLYELYQLSGTSKTAGGPHVADPAMVPVGPGKTNYTSELADTAIRNDYWNWGKGFISAYPPDQFIMLEKGAKYGGQNNQIWAPYYTLHKILAGLLDVYEMSGNEKALQMASGMGDWVHARLRLLPTDTLIKMWNTYIAGEFGGMNEVMARLYRITKKPGHLQTAQLFDNIRVFFGNSQHAHGLAKNVDLFRGLHANQHIPQIVGSVETCRVTNNPDYYKIADNFWHKMMSDYMYSIGGVAGARNPANAECFINQPGTLYENGFSAEGQNETCATYNMLKLTSGLFMVNPQAELMDYYEQALYNHILASVAENSPANTYHVSLLPASVKQFSNADMSGFTCCNGTALESSTKLQDAIYFKSLDNQSLYVNLFVPSTLNWIERKLTVEQTTSFPNEDQTRLTIKGNGKFDLHVRVPAWATNGFFVKINGKQQQLKAKLGSYLKLSRVWKDGDVVELKMPFTFRLAPVMDQSNIASLFYGPVLLAAQEPKARKDWRKITLDAADLSKNIKGSPQQLEFTVDGVLFKPFYQTYGRHSVYLDVELKQ